MFNPKLSSKRRLPIDALKNVVDLEIVLKYHILINNFKTGIFFFQNPMNNQYSTIVVGKLQDNVWAFSLVKRKSDN